MRGLLRCQLGSWFYHAEVMQMEKERRPMCERKGLRKEEDGAIWLDRMGLMRYPTG